MKCLGLNDSTLRYWGKVSLFSDRGCTTTKCANYTDKDIEQVAHLTIKVKVSAAAVVSEQNGTDSEILPKFARGQSELKSSSMDWFGNFKLYG